MGLTMFCPICKSDQLNNPKTTTFNNLNRRVKKNLDQAWIHSGFDPFRYGKWHIINFT
jgi:hypothetical protein